MFDYFLDFPQLRTHEKLSHCAYIELDAYSSPSMGSAGHHTNLFSADDDDYSGSVSSLGSCEVRAVPTAVLKTTTTAEKSATMGTRTSWSSDGRFVDSLASDNDSMSGERMTAAKGKMKKFESSNKINSGRLLNNPISRLLYAQ
jgi:hypothetical protein